MGSILCYIMPLVINSLSGGDTHANTRKHTHTHIHTHTQTHTHTKTHTCTNTHTNTHTHTHTDDLYRINFKKQGTCQPQGGACLV